MRYLNRRDVVRGGLATAALGAGGGLVGAISRGARAGSLSSVFSAKPAGSSFTAVAFQWLPEQRNVHATGLADDLMGNLSMIARQVGSTDLIAVSKPGEGPFLASTRLMSLCQRFATEIDLHLALPPEHTGQVPVVSPAGDVYFLSASSESSDQPVASDLSPNESSCSRIIIHHDSPGYDPTKFANRISGKSGHMIVLTPPVGRSYPADAKATALIDASGNVLSETLPTLNQAVTAKFQVTDTCEVCLG